MSLDSEPTPSTPAGSSAAHPHADPATLLARYIEGDVDALLRGLRLYVVRFGLCPADRAGETALEVLDDLVVIAMSIADRFDPTRQPHAWLLRIGINAIRKRRTSQARRYGHERIASDIRIGDDGGDDGMFFDHVASTLTPEPGNQVASDEQVQQILGLLSEADRQVIVLAKLVGFKGPDLARRLSITPTNARARLHRALGRLREQLLERTKGEDGNA